MNNLTLYRARFVLPITSSLIEDGAVLVEGTRIRAVGPYPELSSSYPCATVVDFGESILLPPMVNAHTHLELSAFASWATAAGEPVAPQTFVDWVLWLVRVRRGVNDEQLHTSLLEGLTSCLNVGTGAVGDILTTLGGASAYKASPLYGKVFAEVLGQNSHLVETRLDDILKVAFNAPSDLLDWALSPHAPYTLSPSALDQVFAFAENQSWPCSIHLAESAHESEFLKSGSGEIADKLYAAAQWDPSANEPPGCSPVAALCRQGRLKKKDLVVHGVNVDRADVILLKETGCSVVLCPRSNSLLNVGKAPVADYLKYEVPLALGTDSLASSGSLSIWEEMAFATDWFAGEATPNDWLEIATLGGAKALGLESKIGQLSEGCDASFQVVTLPQMPCIDDLEAILCSSGQDVTVTHLYLAAQNVLPEM